MAKSKASFGKREREKDKLKKKQEKQEKKEERKANKGSDESMFAYVDEFGQLSSTPPDPAKKIVIELEDVQISIPKDDGSRITYKTGKVASFNHAKGYGFIKEDGTQESYFVHINDTEEPLNDNDRVTFEVVKSPKGYNAVLVKKIK